MCGALFFVLIWGFAVFYGAAAGPPTSYSGQYFPPGRDCQNGDLGPVNASVPAGVTEHAKYVTVTCASGFGHGRGSATFELECSDGFFLGSASCTPRCDLSDIFSSNGYVSVKDYIRGFMVDKSMIEYATDVYINCQPGKRVEETGKDFFKATCTVEGRIDPLLRCVEDGIACFNSELFAYNGAVVMDPVGATPSDHSPRLRCLPGYQNPEEVQCNNGTWSDTSVGCVRRGCSFDDIDFSPEFIGGEMQSFSDRKPVDLKSYDSFYTMEDSEMFQNKNLYYMYVRCASGDSVRPAILKCHQTGDYNGYWTVHQKCHPDFASCRASSEVLEGGGDVASINRPALDGELIRVKASSAIATDIDPMDQVDSLCERRTEYWSFVMLYACDNGTPTLLRTDSMSDTIDCIGNSQALKVQTSEALGTIYTGFSKSDED